MIAEVSPYRIITRRDLETCLRLAPDGDFHREKAIDHLAALDD